MQLLDFVEKFRLTTSSKLFGEYFCQQMLYYSWNKKDYNCKDERLIGNKNTNYTSILMDNQSNG